MSTGRDPAREGGRPRGHHRRRAATAALACLSLSTAADIEAMLRHELAAALAPPAPSRSDDLPEIPRRSTSRGVMRSVGLAPDRYVGKIPT